MKKGTKEIIIVMLLLIAVLVVPSKIFANENDVNKHNQMKASFHVNVKEYSISSYLSNNIDYFFLPKTIDISNLSIYYSYNSDIKELSSGSNDSENNVILNDFSNNDTLTVIFSDDQIATIKVMQSDIASVCITLKDDISLNEVNSGSKDIKYKATCQVIGSVNGDYDIYDDDTEFKGRGNTTWSLDKKGYQIKLKKKQNLLNIRKW